MTCDEARERLPWLLNGSLTEAETRAVEDHLAGCAGCREELEQTRLAARLFATHPSTGDLVCYVFGDLEATDAQRVAEHIASCAPCREELAMVTASQQQIGRLETVPRRWASRPAAVSWLPLAASIVLALLAATGWIWTWRRLAIDSEGWSRRVQALESDVKRLERVAKTSLGGEPPAMPTATPTPDQQTAERLASLEREIAGLRVPEAGVGVVELLPEEMVVRSSRDTQVSLPAGRAATLLLMAEKVAAGERYQVLLSRSGGPTLWRGTASAVATGELTLHLPAGALEAGRYTVRLQTLRGEVLGTYALELR